MSRDQDLEAQIEEVVSAFRARSPEGRVLPSPAWRDLDEEGRRSAYDEARRQRAIEAALDEDGLSTTARAVLDRLATKP